MKLLAALSLLQTAAIAFLLVKMANLDEVIKPMPVVESAVATGSSSAGKHDLEEEQLRKVIREELASHLNSRSGAVNDERAPTASSPINTIDQRAQMDLVARQLEHYKSQGVISESEMQNLQVEIAKLDKPAQKQMLSKLVKAMNSGEIRGAL